MIYRYIVYIYLWTCEHLRDEQIWGHIMEIWLAASQETCKIYDSIEVLSYRKILCTSAASKYLIPNLGLGREVTVGLRTIFDITGKRLFLFLYLWTDIRLDHCVCHACNESHRRNECRQRNKMCHMQTLIMTPLKYCIWRSLHPEISFIGRRTPEISHDCLGFLGLDDRKLIHNSN